MIEFDGTSAALGLAVGIVMSAVFFAFLAIGMRLALRSANPVKVLSLSATLRIAALLGIGWAVAAQAGPWAALGYAAAFVGVRFVATTFARSGARGAP